MSSQNKLCLMLIANIKANGMLKVHKQYVIACIMQKKNIHFHLPYKAMEVIMHGISVDRSFHNCLLYRNYLGIYISIIHPCC